MTATKDTLQLLANSLLIDDSTYVVDDTDLSEPFREFQMNIFYILETRLLSFRYDLPNLHVLDDICDLLYSSSDNKNHAQQEVSNRISHILNDVAQNCLSGDPEEVRELLASNIAKLQRLAVNYQDSIITRIINCIISLVIALPVDLDERIPSKHNLIRYYLRPIIDPLFDNFVVNGDTNERGVSCDGTITNGGFTIGFLAAESFQTVTVKNTIIYELGALGSSVLNDNNSNFSFSVMAVETHLRFFIHQRATESMTLMIEIGDLHFPSYLGELPMLYGFLHELLSVTYIVYHN